MKRSRKFLSLLLTVAMMFTALPGAGIFLSYADDTVQYKVSLSSDSASVTAGDTFDVALNVSADASGASVAALHSEVRYDASKLQLIKVSSEPDSGITADGKAKDGVIQVEAFGSSQTIPADGSAAMAVLTFKALDIASGDVDISLVSESSFVGVSGNTTDIKAETENEALKVSINAPDPDKFDITFGLPDDGLTWNLLTVNGEDINRSVKGGETLTDVVAQGDSVTFSIDADEGVYITNVIAYYSKMERNYDPFVKISDEKYTFTVNASKNYSVNATTLNVSEINNKILNVSFTDKHLISLPTSYGMGYEMVYPSLEIRFDTRDGSRLTGCSYTTDGKKWTELGTGSIDEDGVYTVSKERISDCIYEKSYSGREGDEDNYYIRCKNLCYILKADFTESTIKSIATEEDLIKFAESVNNGDDYLGVTVKLADDITLTKPWSEPVGADREHVFSGVFDGNNKTVSGLDISYTFTDPDNEDSATGRTLSGKAFGLFGYVINAQIKDLTVVGKINIDNTVKYENDPQSSKFDYEKNGPTSYIGGIAASADNTDFNNCVSEVDITAHGGYIGGIAGCIERHIVNGQYIEYKGTTFTDCFNYGDINVTRRNRSACGIASIYGNYKIESMLRCGNYGNITIKGTKVKTIVGSAASSGSTEVKARADDTATGQAAGLTSVCSNVTECFNKGSIIGIAAVEAGLLSGIQYSEGDDYKADIVIKDSYNTGTIELPIEHLDWSDPSNRQAYTAGIIAHITGTLSLTNCYNSGTVISKTTQNGRSDTLYVTDDRLSAVLENVYAKGKKQPILPLENLTAASLNTGTEVRFKDDTGSVNGGMPLLMWESSNGSDEQYDITFDMDGVNGSVTVYSDEARTQVIDAASAGRYSLKAGTYYYTAKADGYEDVLGSFSVVRKPVSVTVNFRAVVDITITVSPANAKFTLETLSGEAVQPKNAANGVYVFTLYKDVSYKYNAEASGYVSQGRTLTADGTPLTVTLTKSSTSGGVTEDNAIYGSYNIGKTSKITKGGTYYIQKGADTRSQGWITISTTEPVTLIGNGYSDSAMYEDLYIKYTVSGADLTIEDVYIHNTLDSDKKDDLGNIIDFQGSGNKFSFSGTNILDWDGNASGYAAIHVNKSTDLTINASDSDRLYIYKHEQGAAIGGNGGADSSKGDGGDGQDPETNGNITFNGGTYFIKNSKQGAGIGAGAQAGSQKPGKIHLNGGSFYIIANSRGASIGGSAGSNGASAGSDVYISDSASVTVNVDFAGAAIGGGGFDGGNDTDGGTMYYDSGSVRTYIDVNAVSQWDDVTSAGVNGNIAITADIVNGSGKPLYLLELDTSKLSKSASYFNVKDGNNTVYSGGLHEYRYINEDSIKGGQAVLSYTIDNWISLDDPQLYLYMTGEDHSLTVNNETVVAKWDASSESFTLTYPDGTTGGNTTGGGSLIDDKTPLVSEVIKADPKVSGSDASASVKKEDVDGAVKAVGDSSNAEIVIDSVSGKSGITRAEVSVPMDSVKTIQKDTKADIVLKTDLGDITVDNKDLTSLIVGTGSDVTFTIDKNSDGSMKLNITSGGKNLAAGRYILKYKYKIDDAVLKSLAGKTGVDNSDLVGVLLGAKGADGNVTQTVIRESFVTADGYLILNAPAGGTVTVAANGKTFGDVASNSWYAKAVGFAVSHELFNGVSEDEFAPSKSMTRGMFVTVLNRLAGEEDFNGKADFTDVSADAWYATGTAWAASKGIVSGYGDGRFGPNDPVTREQMAVIMYNFTKAMNYDIKGNAALTKFSDSASVHSWAAEAMQWAAGSGVMSGNADGTLNPRGTATRAQVATIMSNYIQVLLGVK